MIRYIKTKYIVLVTCMKRSIIKVKSIIFQFTGNE